MFTIAVDGKPVRVSLTARAQRALAARDAVLVVNMELYFSCLIRKRLHFADGTPVKGDSRIDLFFSPVVARQCRLDVAPDANQDLMPLETTRRRAFVPAWLKLDFRGHWQGEFGFASEEA